MLIRKFKEEDARKASSIIRRCFQEINSKHYTEDAIKYQIKENSPTNLIKKSKTVNYFVATEKERILGIGGYDETKVITFFVHPQMHRKGIGKKIMERILSEARKEGMKSLVSWSTFYAETFYTAFGFQKMKQLTLPSGKNSTITFVEMKRIL